MTKDQTNIATALAAAQSEMGAALKTAENPHFRSRYADLASVMAACMPALNKHGIAVIQPPCEDEHGRSVETILIHGESGEMLSCRVPLIVAKNDMQAYGSAVTYARRYGLMAMAGIAPEDDDGNAAAKGAPTAPASISAEQFVELRDLAEQAGVPAEKICEAVGATSLEQFPADKLAAAKKKLQLTIDKKANADSGPKPDPAPEPPAETNDLPAETLDGDSIPF